MTIEPLAVGSRRGWTDCTVVRLIVLGLLPAVLLTSCAPKNATSLHPVQGRVLYKDTPATGARP